MTATRRLRRRWRKARCAASSANQVLIRHRDEGSGDPDSIFDMSCDLFDFPSWDTLVRLPTLPDLLGELCDAARAAWRENVTRPFDRSIWSLDRELDRLPGLDTDIRPTRRRIETSTARLRTCSAGSLEGRTHEDGGLGSRCGSGGVGLGRLAGERGMLRLRLERFALG